MESAQASFDATLTRLARAVYAAFARASGGGSPAAFVLAWLDWMLHLVCTPAKHDALATHVLAYLESLMTGSLPNHLGDNDPRFDDPSWGHWPFNLLRDAFAQFDWFWQQATTDVRGVSPRNEQMMHFATRQCTDMLSPANCWWLNPQVLRRLSRQGGATSSKAQAIGSKTWRTCLRAARQAVRFAAFGKTRRCFAPAMHSGASQPASASRQSETQSPTGEQWVDQKDVVDGPSNHRSSATTGRDATPFLRRQPAARRGIRSREESYRAPGSLCSAHISRPLSVPAWHAQRTA